MPPPKGLVKKLEKTGDLVKAPSRKGEAARAPKRRKKSGAASESGALEENANLELEPTAYAGVESAPNEVTSAMEGVLFRRRKKAGAERGAGGRARALGRVAPLC